MQQQWWHGKTAYQIYPKSFYDSNGDGIGDIKGIIAKLPYLHALGIEILWISPIYKSPFVDNGYDIADYQAIDPTFGTMEDFDELLARAKELGIAIIMDLVVNHCSSEHEWFKRACANPHGEEASYFYFREGVDGHAPNNLRANFGGSVWDKVPGQDNLYYCHFFAKEQPDLNWFNPKLRQKIYQMINWWLDKGVAGFRIDAIMSIGKDPTFPNYTPDALGDGMCACGAMNAQCNDVATRFLQEMQATVFRQRRAFTVGEVFSLQEDNLADFIGDEGNFSTIFDFGPRQCVCNHCAYYAYDKLTIAQYRAALFKSQRQAAHCGFIAPVIENHDEPRGVSCYLPPMWHNAAGAKALGTIIMLLRGIPFIYQGQELGMLNVQFNSIDEFNDLQSVEEYRRCLQHGLSKTEALAVLNAQARDHARTPMPWTGGAQAGFTLGQPWMRLQQDYPQVNVAAQDKDPNSVLQHYRRLVALKKEPSLQQLLTYGSCEEVDTPYEAVICYRRTLDSQILYVAANFGEWDATLHLPGARTLSLSTGKVQLQGDKLHLDPGSSAVIVG